MNVFIDRLFRLLGRALLLAVGLIVAASLALAALVLLAGWGVYAAWARLTGRPVLPFVLRQFDPRAGFGRFYRRAGEPQPASRTPRADANRSGPRAPSRPLEITDVDSRPAQR